MTTTTNFLGIPVEGDITRSRRSNIEQWDLVRLQEILVPLLAFDELEGIRWTQYTPYFNDGDPCEFLLGDPRFRVKGMEQPEDEDSREEDEDGYDSVSFVGSYTDAALLTLVGLFETSWEGARGTPERKQVRTFSKQGSNPELARLMFEFADNHEHFENVFLEAFGDHAIVTIKRDGIEVESYEHE